MKNKILRVMFICILSMLALVSCVTDKERNESKITVDTNENQTSLGDFEYKYNSNISDSFYENFSFYEQINSNSEVRIKEEDDYKVEKFNHVIKFEKTEYDDMNVYFDSDIEEEYRKSFIKDCYPLIKYVKSKYDIEDKLEYYVENVFDSACDGEKIYIKYDGEFDSHEFIEESLLGIFGERSNYGLIYSEIKDIEEALPYCEYIKPIVNEDYYKKQIESNVDYADLTYPLFADEFKSSVEIDLAKKMAVDFSSYIKTEYGKEAFYNLLETSSEFDASFDETYVAYMNEFLKNQNINAEMQISDITIRYSKILGKKYQMNMASEWVDYRFEKGYADIYANMRYDYSDIKKYIQQIEKNAIKLRAYWKEDIDDSLKRLPCYFTNSDSFCLGGVADTAENIVMIKKSSSFIHEYTHYLYRTNYDEKNNLIDTTFFSEGRAVFSEALVNEKCKRSMYAAFSRKEDNADKKNIDAMFEKYLKSIDKCTINRELFDDGDIHMAYLEIISYYTFKNLDWTEDSVFNYYRFGPVFTKYIIDNYGLEKYRKVYLNPSEFEETYDGKSIADMREEVIEYLNNKYDELF